MHRLHRTNVSEEIKLEHLRLTSGKGPFSHTFKQSRTLTYTVYLTDNDWRTLREQMCPSPRTEAKCREHFCNSSWLSWLEWQAALQDDTPRRHFLSETFKPLGVLNADSFIMNHNISIAWRQPLKLPWSPCQAVLPGSRN